MHGEGLSSGSFGKLCYTVTDPAKTNISTHAMAGKVRKKFFTEGGLFLQ